jgi:Fe-S cluster assembly protein SufB
MSENKNNINIKKFFLEPYKYGFTTNISNIEFPKGINEIVVRSITLLKEEPDFIEKFRYKAYKLWKKKKFPTWSNLTIAPIDFQSIVYYSIPEKVNNQKVSSKMDQELLNTFTKLGISLEEKNECSGIALDIVFDSISISTTYKEKLAKEGIIFCSISEGIQKYPKLMKRYLASVVSVNDNFFAALNSAIFTDGSFCYIPKNVKCPLELSTYFRINNQNSGQFERTLIIAESNSSIKYLEGCTAPQYDKNQVHAAIVELIAYDNSKIEYSTVQNWYSGDSKGIGGIYNFVTKRGLCLGQNSQISWTQVETGSAITWKYPSCILLGEKSIGEFYSIALTKNFQQADTGTKMIHLGQQTNSKIMSKGISSGYSKNSYRGLVRITGNAKFSRNFSQCDSFLLGNKSISSTYPYLEIFNSTSILEHEATISKINDEQLFYLQQRGISIEKAISILINGFCKDVVIKLPLEFALEADKLLSLQIENSIG